MGSAICSFFLKNSGNISCIKRKVRAGHPQQTIRKIRGTAATMKTLAPLTLLTLVCFVSAGLVSQEFLLKERCCLNSSSIRIPKEKVTHVEMTPAGCKHNAIVVTSVCGKRFCLKDSWNWAIKLLQRFETVSVNKTSLPAPFNQTRCKNNRYVEMKAEATVGSQGPAPAHQDNSAPHLRKE
ncbi:uncharacterized protein LOC109514342 isoform X2 [Hippocampus comes]|uniref:uncharacterized protein LOC109514342 isoform X2 n=1 Tax=Hippocampus comes TaxID=109280 RepID=UPI00094F05E2|nr:PREDICTED: uncharacterized protein LOC109514342 isoform X2 [Hippocampus comes]